MGTKKHKKESKKRKRSRSGSPGGIEYEEKERKRHHKKKHKKEKKTCKKLRRESSSSSDSDDDVMIIDSPSPPPPPIISLKNVSKPPPEPVFIKEPTPPLSNSRESLSIAETNALRAKLGLKPLQIDQADVSRNESSGNVEIINDDDPDVVLIEGEEGQFVHKPAESLTRKKETEKLRNKITERKEKRTLEKKYTAVKTLGDDSEDDDSAAAWVNKSRKIEDEKKLAQRRAAELDEMDEIFGVSNLINDEIKKEKDKSYSKKDLKGLTVEHDIENFSEGKTVILTLKDKGVLEEDNSDTLVNVNMIDDERYKKNILNKKQNPYEFNHLYDEDEDDMLDVTESKVLRKYDEEIQGEKKSKFILGEKNPIPIKDKVKAKLRANMTLESLDTNLSLASDYYTSEEITKFKKPKKVRKIRKKALKADDLIAIAGPEHSGVHLGSRHPKTEVKEESDILDTDDTTVVGDLSRVSIKVEEPEEESELESALSKARKLRQMRQKPTPSFVELGKQIINEIKQEPDSDDEASGSIVLNSTAEFCRTLGDIPTYGLAGNREEADQVENPSAMEEERIKWANNYRPDDDEGGWQDAQMDLRPVEINKIEAEPILDAEPDVGSGVAGALHLAVSKGYLEKESTNRPNAARFTHLQAQNYSIEDKSHVEDEKHGNRRDRYMGPTSDFKEKDTYKPKINLEYIDDDGRILTPKEAFRYLSHKFHGKGPGKNKIEKRMKKNEQEVLMKQMSSSDTPLGTLQMLQYKQKETQSPYVVLSGNKQLSAPSISKTKMLK